MDSVTHRERQAVQKMEITVLSLIIMTTESENVRRKAMKRVKRGSDQMRSMHAQRKFPRDLGNRAPPELHPSLNFLSDIETFGGHSRFSSSKSLSTYRKWVAYIATARASVPQPFLTPATLQPGLRPRPTKW